MSVRTWLRDKVWHKTWTAAQLQKYIGEVRGSYYTYATDDALRARASSGGSVSALLGHLLATGEIDGALVCRTVIKDNKPRPEFFIAETRAEIMAAQGSKYTAVYFATNALPLLKAYPGQVAVVALPCDAKILAAARTKSAELDAKIAAVIALFCGHNSEPALADALVTGLSDGDSALVGYTFRFGHWRGKLAAEYADGTTVEKPFSYFSDYRNLYCFAQTKCHHCFDHYGYYADISAGDIWSPEMKHDPIKHTALLTRTEAGERIVQQAAAAGALAVQEEPLYKIADGQARTMPFHYNITARARVGRLFGLKIADPVAEPVRWNDYLVAFIALLNERLTRKRWGQRLILALPRPLIRLYLLVFKGLER